MKNPRILKVVALVTSVGLMGAYVGHRALRADAARSAPAPTPAAEPSTAVAPQTTDVAPVLPRPTRMEMMAGSKSLIGVFTPDEVAQPEAPPAPKTPEAQQTSK